MSIVQQERETYERMWAVDAYNTNSPGESCVPFFLDMAKPRSGCWILDAGCGAGRGAKALDSAKFMVSMVDITSSALDDKVRGLPFWEMALWDDLAAKIPTHDWVYCCDVLEHIPTPFTMLVISRLLEVATKGVFLSISLMPDQFGVVIGKTLHQTVQTFPQWRDQLDTVGRVVESRDLLANGLYLVERR